MKQTTTLYPIICQVSNNDQDCWYSVGKEDHMCIDCNDCNECKLNTDTEWWMDFPKLSPFIKD